MATVSAVILKHQKKQDGTWNAKIRISHQGRSVYLDTPIYASRSDLDTKLRLKKVFIDNHLTSMVKSFRDKINLLGSKTDYMTAADIKNHLTANTGSIDFFTYCERYISDLLNTTRVSTGKKRQSSYRSFKAFIGRDTFPVEMLTSKVLKDYEKFMKTQKKSVNTIRNNMADLAAMFNSAKDEYNNEELGLIRIYNSPFSKYKAPPVPESTKKALDVEFLKYFRDLHLKTMTVADTRDLFILSLYMCGVNLVDFYMYLTDPNIERFDFYRWKTKGEDGNKSFMSIKVIPEAKPLIEKFAGTLQKRFKSSKGLNNMVYKTFKEFIHKEVDGFPMITYYHARHTFATLASKCGYSSAEVGVALAHSDGSMANRYIDRDWSLVDRMQRDVVNLLK